MSDRDPLGIGFEPASHSLLPPFVCARFRSGGQSALRFGLIAAQLFPRRPLNRIRRAARRFRDACSGALHGRDKCSVQRSRWRVRVVPVEESLDCPRVCHTRVAVTDAGGEEFDEAELARSP